MANKETLLTRNIINYVKKTGNYCYKFYGGNQFSEQGVPDLLCSIEGRFVGIEVKYGKNKPSKLQEEQISRINKRGGIGFFVNEKN